MVTMAPARPALTNVLCRGKRKDGSPCNQVLFKAEATDFNRHFEQKCPRCGEIARFGPIG